MSQKAIKDLSYYLSLQYDEKVDHLPEEEGGGWFAEIPLLGGFGVVFATGDTKDEAIKSMREMKERRLSEWLEEGREIPEPGDERPSGKFIVRTSRDIHRWLQVEAGQEGISFNLHINHLLAAHVYRQGHDRQMNPDLEPISPPRSVFQNMGKMIIGENLRPQPQPTCDSQKASKSRLEGADKFQNNFSYSEAA